MVLVAASQPARGQAVVLVVQSELFQSFFLHSSRLGGGGAGCAAQHSALVPSASFSSLVLTA